MKEKILIGGAWPYANYKLHMGHVSCLIPGDVIARYYRKKGAEVVYVSGTDCHGTPTTVTAKKEGVSVEEIATKYHNSDKADFEKLGISYDIYASTMDQEHKIEVMNMFEKIYDNGYIYEKDEDQDYCDTCSMFLSDRDIKGICPHCGEETRADQCDNCLLMIEDSELKDKKCSTCGNPSITKSNKHLYIALSKFQKAIEGYVNDYSSNWRKNAVNETNKFLKMGLIDRAATRQLDWGVDVPVKGFEDKKIYVWIEAVMGYLTTAKRVCEKNGVSYEEFITSPNLKSYYVHGKDNIIFHTIIYPALIMSLESDYNLPNYIVSSEYLNNKDEKMSKSKGNYKTLTDMLNEFPVDSIRYYLIAFGPEKKDSNYSDDDFIQIHNKTLCGVLGNFVNRNFSFIKKKFDGVITEGKVDDDVKNKTIALYDEVSDLIERAELRSAIERVIEYVQFGNRYYDESAPWIKVKEEINEFNNITYTCTYMIANIANLLSPFLPETSDKINSMLGIESNEFKEVTLSGDINLEDIKILFERIDTK